jgi:hypothetical protein
LRGNGRVRGISDSFGGGAGACWRRSDSRWGLGVMARRIFTAGFVFLFMVFLALQAATGFMRDLFAGGVYPRAMRALDTVLETLFTQPLGQAGGAILLFILGLLFAWLVWSQANPEKTV